MKIFSLKRLIGAAALYGIVRYVKANGGPKAVFDDLKLKVNDLIGAAKSGAENLASQSANTAQSDGPGAREPSTPSSYASYKLNDDRNLH